jgi:hypothetical protein
MMDGLVGKNDFDDHLHRRKGVCGEDACLIPSCRPESPGRSCCSLVAHPHVTNG